MKINMTHQDFESIVGETVELTVGHVSFRTRVDQVRLLQKNPDQNRQPFAVELLAENTDDHGQQIYELSHPKLGKASLFAVPLGPEEEGMRYEIVFN